MNTAIGADSEGQKHVLVCDDERHIVRLIRVNLERQRFRVSTASSGIEALQKMKADRPDLVVLDAEMPGMSGKEVWEAMQADHELAGIPVIVLGKHDDWGDRDGNGPSGAVMTLTKPLAFARILDYLRQ